MPSFVFAGSREALEAFERTTRTKDTNPLTATRTKVDGIEYPNGGDSDYTIVVSSQVKESQAGALVDHIEDRFDMEEVTVTP